MPLDVKICGLKTDEAVAAAIEGGAAYIGFVFYAGSSRAISPGRAGELGRGAARKIIRCGLFVDADTPVIQHAIERADLDMIQLHGGETPDAAYNLRIQTGLPVMKALGIRHANDLAVASRWAGAVDMLLFDAKPPDDPVASPGGNGVPFDWRILAGFQAEMPWMLSGGLNAANLAEAVQLTGTQRVDVSSGVESRPGVKDPGLIKAFLGRARGIETRSRR